MNQTHRPSTEDGCGTVSPPEWGSLQQPVSVKAAAAGAGQRRRGNPARVASPDNSIEQIVAPAAIERALSIYRQLQEREWSVVVQARKILTQHVYAMIDQGENDEHRLTVGGLAHLKSVERDHAIRSASDSQNCKSSTAHSQLPVAKAAHQG